MLSHEDLLLSYHNDSSGPVFDPIFLLFRRAANGAWKSDTAKVSLTASADRYRFACQFRPRPPSYYPSVATRNGANSNSCIFAAHPPRLNERASSYAWILNLSLCLFHVLLDYALHGNLEQFFTAAPISNFD